jgi:hypothetical protein
MKFRYLSSLAVDFRDLRNLPYKATVEFEKVFYTTADHARFREICIASPMDLRHFRKPLRLA